MGYINPKIPEGINVTDEHPLKDFIAMLVAVGFIAIATLFTLVLAAEQLVRFIPFDVEQSLAQSFISAELTTDDDSNEQAKQRIESYLQQLAEQLIHANATINDQTERYPVTVHYVDSDEVNAFATLGGHVLIFRGLLEQMPNENALAMVIGHEIAHIQHRDPIVALGRGITIGLAIMSIAGAGDGAVSEQLLSQFGLVSHLSFSRKHEIEADDYSLHMLGRYYGHVGAADSLFSHLLEQQDGLQPPVFLSTHPLNEDRIARIKRHPKYRPDAPLQALPAWLIASLQKY